MNAINFMENFNNKIVIPGNGLHGEKHVYSEKSESSETKTDSAHERDVKEIVEELNRLSGRSNEKIQFSFQEKTNRVIMKVLDKDTNEVIREIPARYSLKLLEHFQEFLGVLIDESR